MANSITRQDGAGARFPSSKRIDDARILVISKLVSPARLLRELPTTERTRKTALRARDAIHDVLHGRDDRLVVVVGPCSIHDCDAAIEYARRLAHVAAELRHHLIVVMRVYFEKPRTTIGWKGLINDPGLDNSFRINDGLRLARRLLLQINELGLATGTEYLDMITPQYIADVVAWGAIGARTTESQIHRQLASGLSCPVGFKNGTNGDVGIAVDAIRAARVPHRFLSVTKGGHSAIVQTAGNDDCHIVLRGGKGTTNFDAASVALTCQKLAAAGLTERVMIDCSHANAERQHERQLAVAADIGRQIAGGERRIAGVMLESNLHPGRQDLVPGRPPAPGVSITDPCIGWRETSRVLDDLAEAVHIGRSRGRRAPSEIADTDGDVVMST
ncbi:MAG: 3-deoxy-7-phosphoheptulonate synthase [Polyangiaceae bacterium]